MHGENFLDEQPNEEDQKIINTPVKLIRQQIFPYKNVSDTVLKENVYITTMFSNFTKSKDKNFINGTVIFYIIVSTTLEKTSYGSRYDFIGDELEDIFNNTGIGVFEFKGRGDIDFPKDDFQCHMIRFDITDFHIALK